MIRYTYYLSGSADEYGNLQSRRETPFSVHRVSGGVVEFWDPNDQTWNESELYGRRQLVDDLLQSGAWIRQMQGRDEFARDVPNYHPDKFGA